MKRHDLIVIGGGPAGSAVAIAAARRGLSVVLFERSRGPIAKVCGEVLSEPGAALAHGLGCAGIEETLCYDTVMFNDAEGRHPAVAMRLRPTARGVPRTLLDEGLLAAAARAGVDVRRGVRVTRRERRGEKWCVAVAGSAEPMATAPRIVLATGRVTAPGPGAWVGYREMTPVSGSGVTGQLSMTLGPGRDYFGEANLSKDGTTRTLLTPADDVVGTACTPGLERRGTPPFRLGMVRMPAEAGVYRIGDAMAAWPPLVGDGMTAALVSGVQLGEHLARGGLESTEWPSMWHAMHGATLRRALWLHAIVTRPAWRAPLWRLAAAFAGVTSLIEGGVRLPAAGRGATRVPCTREG